MFAIARPAQAEQPDAAMEEAQPEAQPEAMAARRPVVFRNVIPGGAVPLLGSPAGALPTAAADYLSSPLTQREQASQRAPPQRLRVEAVETTAATRPAAAAAAAAAVGAAVGAAVAPVQLQQPLPRQQQVPSLSALQAAAFSIQRAPPSPAAQQAAAAAAAPTLGQFAAMQPPAQQQRGAAPAEVLAQQRQQLLERQPRSPTAAATIDEVLSSLRGRSSGAGAASVGGRPPGSLAQFLSLSPPGSSAGGGSGAPNGSS